MPKEWTAELVGLMHLHRITMSELANHLGISKQYASMVFNGHRDPPEAEVRFQKAVAEIIQERKENAHE